MKPPKNFYSSLDRRKQGLPEVPEASATDVGKVIKVGSNGYELASDAGAKLVTAMVTTDGQGNHSCDKTYEELSASIANGDIVELSYLNQTFVFSGIDYTGIHFALSRNDSNGHNVITAWTISNSDVITFLIDEINSELPTVTSADAGKVLGVDDNGALEFANIPKEVNIIDCTVNPANHTITFNDTIANVCNSILNHEFTIIKGLYESINYNMIFVFKANFIDTYDNSIYCDTTQFQANSCTMYGFTIKPSLSGNSTTYYQKNLAFT